MHRTNGMFTSPIECFFALEHVLLLEMGIILFCSGIDVVRGRIKMFAQQRVNLPAGRHKMIILDEADRCVVYNPIFFYSCISVLEHCRLFVYSFIVFLHDLSHLTSTHTVAPIARSMTEAAQQALRRTIELYAKTTRFFFACNDSAQIIGLSVSCSICILIRCSRCFSTFSLTFQ